MIVQEFLRSVDINKQVDLICENKPNYEPEYDRSKVKHVQEIFINKLMNITPNISNEDIIVFEKHWDSDFDDKTLICSICPELYNINDLNIYLENTKNIKNHITSIDESLSSEELKSLCYKYDVFPTTYSFIFTEWKDILGWKVYTGNLDNFDIQECLYSLLYEMSFNGVTEESQEERRSELDESIKRGEELDKLPPEEREKNYITLEEMEERWKEEFGWEPPTKDELANSTRMMWLSALKTASWRFDNFKNLTI